MIDYVVGDCLKGFTAQRTYVLHITNNCGQWGAGFVLALNAFDPAPRIEYLLDASEGRLELGTVREARCTKPENDGIVVLNACAQDNSDRTCARPLHYGALAACLVSVADLVRAYPGELRMPLIGAGIGRGDWTIIEELIDGTVGAYNPKVYVLPGAEMPTSHV